ncbi:hypothetical protein Mal4_35010 [Maioricimonas rarisocia]|uniref:Uncharacterized protein n=1 Tax=Maioricimonas rarisocia TaxID=2528026 RepID=A0A517Z9K5_9PLAN|nr:hypothetical protein [Maioricimonas rarisocia]QDU39165.1 hypothetical protein Mal4_35010 [Maioricimonas rarisocia]
MERHGTTTLVLGLLVLSGIWAARTGAQPPARIDGNAEAMAARVDQLEQQLHVLAERVEQLEAQTTRNAIEQLQHQLPAPDVPKAWSKRDFNGTPYYIVPLGQQSGEEQAQSGQLRIVR